MNLLEDCGRNQRCGGKEEASESSGTEEVLGI
jgi:hypothetical protein